MRRWKIVTVSVAFTALGWLGGDVEVFVGLWLLGTPRSAGTAFVIETMLLIISAVLFLIPWQARTQEAGKALIFGFAGFRPPADSLSVSSSVCAI